MSEYTVILYTIKDVDGDEELDEEIGDWDITCESQRLRKSKIIKFDDNRNLKEIGYYIQNKILENEKKHGR